MITRNKSRSLLVAALSAILLCSTFVPAQQAHAADLVQTVANGDFTNCQTTPWLATGTSQLGLGYSTIGQAKCSLSVDGRGKASDGVQQDLSAAAFPLEEGKTYSYSLWFKNAGSQDDIANVVLQSSLGKDIVLFHQNVKAGDTASPSGTFTVKSGEFDPDSAVLLVNTFNGTGRFFIDDVSITTTASNLSLEELGNLVEDNRYLDESVYTAESFEPFQEALDNAIRMVEHNDSNLSEEKIASTYSDLETAVKNLVPLPSSIAITAQPTKTQYTVGDTFDPSGLKVEGTFADGSTSEVPDTEYTIAAVSTDKAGKVTVTVTWNADKSKSATFDITVTADKAGLNKQIEAAKALNLSNYTDDSAATLTQALDAAEKVAADTNASQEAVEDSAKTVEKAIQALVKKGETEPTKPDTKPDTKPGAQSGSQSNQDSTTQNPLASTGVAVASIAALTVLLAAAALVLRKLKRRS